LTVDKFIIGPIPGGEASGAPAWLETLNLASSDWREQASLEQFRGATAGAERFRRPGKWAGAGKSSGQEIGYKLLK
jgi:hypothetical protein